MTFDDWFVKSSIPDSMKHDLFDCWFQALVSRDPEVSELRQQVTLLRDPLLYIDEVAKTSKTIISVAAAAMKMLKKIRAALAATKET